MRKKTINISRAELRGWIDDLRSGKYDQTGGALGYAGERGPVLCANGVLGHRLGILKLRHGLYCSPSGSGAFLPHNLVDPYVQRHIAHMNDNGRTFAHIADWIEAHLDGNDDVAALARRAPRLRPVDIEPDIDLAAAVEEALSTLEAWLQNPFLNAAAPAGLGAVLEHSTPPPPQRELVAV